MNPTTPLHEDTLNDIPPDHHPIIYLTKMFHNAIQMNQVHKMKLINYLYCNTLKTNLDSSIYDWSKLHEIRQTAMNILKSHLQPPDNIDDWYMNKALQKAIQSNNADWIEHVDRLFILNMRSNSDHLNSTPLLHKLRITAMDILDSFRKSLIPEPYWDLYDFLEFTPKSLNLPTNHSVGAVNPSMGIKIISKIY